MEEIRLWDDSRALWDVYTSEKCEESEPETSTKGIQTIEESVYGLLGPVYPCEESGQMEVLSVTNGRPYEILMGLFDEKPKSRNSPRYPREMVSKSRTREGSLPTCYTDW